MRTGVGGAMGALVASTLLACSVLTSLDGLADGVDGGTLGAAFVDSGSHDLDGAPARNDAGLPAHDAATGPSLDANVDDANTDDGALPGDATTVDACVPTPLVCDGKVHGCNGVVDLGCPDGITVGAPGSSSVLGGDPTVGTPFDDACPSGQVLIGVGGATGQWMDAIHGICGAVHLQASTASAPYTYAVTITAGAILPTRGTVGADPTWQATCGPNQAVVGIAGSSGIAMDRVVLSCAPLLVTGAPGAFALQRGTVTALPSVGDTSGGSPFTPVTCPSPQMITAITGTAAQWLSTLGVACAGPTLATIQ